MTSDAFVISGVRLTHHTASVADLETVSHPHLETRLRNLHGHDSVAEALVLQTCNRVEEYVVAETRSAGREATADFGNDVEEEVIATRHEESLRHLLCVAAGLESQILGEDQVLGQVRDAYSTAESAGTPDYQ